MTATIVTLSLSLALSSTGQGKATGHCHCQTHGHARTSHIVPPGPGNGWGFPNGNPDKYGWVNYGTDLPLGADRQDIGHCPVERCLDTDGATEFHYAAGQPRDFQSAAALKVVIHRRGHFW